MNGDETLGLSSRKAIDAEMQLVLFGPFAFADRGGRIFKISNHKTKALVAMLATAPNGMRTRKWLREHLWSDRSEQQGATSLRQSLSELRRALGPLSTALVTSRHDVSLDLSVIDILEGHEPFLYDVNVKDPAFLSWRDMARHDPSHLAAGSYPFADSVRGGSAGTAPPLVVPNLLKPVDMSGSAMRKRNSHPKVAVASLFATSNPDTGHYATIRGLIRRISRHLESWRRCSIVAPSMAENALLDGGGDPGLRRLKAALDCEYVVDVTLLGRGNTHEIHIDLFDADARLCWTGNFPWTSVGATIEEADEETMKIIAGNVGTVIDNAEQKAAFSTPDDDNLRNLTYRGRRHLLRMSRHDCEIAMELFERAARIDPEDLSLRINVAFGIFARAWATRGPTEDLVDARERARAISTVDETFPTAFYLLGNCESLLRRREEARLSLGQALRLAPSLPLSVAQHGSNLIAEGNFDAAIGTLKSALKYGESDRRRFFILGELAMASYLAGDHREAIDRAEAASGLRSHYWYAHMVRCAAHDELGEDVSATNAARAMFEVRPDLEWADIDWLPFEDRTINDRLWSLCSKYRR